MVSTLQMSIFRGCHGSNQNKHNRFYLRSVTQNALNQHICYQYHNECPYMDRVYCHGEHFSRKFSLNRYSNRDNIRSNQLIPIVSFHFTASVQSV